jgi:1,2-diacylglycerol 3-alpha-glucosyltransferase
MHIAFFVEGMSASGVDTSTRLLADALRAAGHDVVFFHPWKDRETEESRERAVLLPAVRVSSRQPIYWSVPVSWSMIDRFRRERFDLIHVHTSTTINLLAWQAKAIVDLPVVYTYHTMTAEYAHYLGPLAEPLHGMVTPAIEFFDRTICNGADVVVAPSPKAQRYLDSIAIKPPVHLIPNGIDLTRFRPSPAGFLHRRLGIDAERPILLWVGRLNQEKRPLLAYRLFRQIHAAHPNALLVLVGEGALRPELEAAIAADGMTEAVHLYGLAAYDEMPRIYTSATLWLSTSVSEVHPMVALEAAACGLPAVAWNDPALEGVVQEGHSGLLVESESAFVAAAAALLAKPAECRRLAAAALQMASRYKVETTAQRMSDLYATLVDQHRGPRDLSSLTAFLASRPARVRRAEGPRGAAQSAGLPGSHPADGERVTLR